MSTYKLSCGRHAICQIADLLFSFKSGPRYVAMLYAYFDESGHPSSSKVVTVAAVVSTISRWHTFDEKWNRILRRHKIRGLHMTDYENGRGDFTHWKNKDRQAIQFIGDLASILKNNIRFACVYSSPMDDWNEQMAERFPDPYERKRAPFIVLLHCCLEAIKDSDLLPKNKKISCMFEETRFLSGAIPKYLADWKQVWGLDERFGSFSFGGKYEFAGLQGADMLAYEGSKHLLNQHVIASGRPERKLHANLMLSKKIEAAWMDRGSFQSYIKENSARIFSDEQTNS